MMDNDNQLPPAPVAEEMRSEPVCKTCSDHGWIGGPTYAHPDDPGERCPDCNTHPQPAIDVDALAEMLWENEKLDSALRMRRQAKNLAIDICNWIEEHRK